MARAGRAPTRCTLAATPSHFEEKLVSVDSQPEHSSMSARTDPLRAAFLNVNEAATYLGLSPQTLYAWRHRRQGPPSFRMGRRGRVMYRRESLDAWISAQEQADSRSNSALNPVSSRPQQRLDRSSNL
ncbi:helix-turn-helix transcriptional regulator [Streptomyces sp. NPDC004134]|uniref:helix-turn-helix transcriptional regulator n=1 Tax=Streptomyces sp. NPDC004134 TaxID=3364691 RepID=UPI0036B4D9F1